MTPFPHLISQDKFSLKQAQGAVLTLLVLSIMKQLLYKNIPDPLINSTKKKTQSRVSCSCFIGSDYKTLIYLNVP